MFAVVVVLPAAAAAAAAAVVIAHRVSSLDSDRGVSPPSPAFSKTVLANAFRWDPSRVYRGRFGFMVGPSTYPPVKMNGLAWRLVSAVVSGACLEGHGPGTGARCRGGSS